MSISIVGKRYASALLSLADQAGAAEQVGRDLQDFSATFEQSADLRAVFENPGVSQLQRRAILKDIAQQTSMHDLLRDTLQLLADRGRLRHLSEVAEAYQQLYEARSGKVRAEVTTAAEVSPGYLGELEQVLRQALGKDVVLNHKVDPSLIGGVVTRVGDQVFDGSVKNRLSELKDELLK